MLFITSTVVELALTGELPFKLQTAVRAYVYRRICIIRQAREGAGAGGVESFELRARRLVWARWRVELCSHAGERAAGALLPHFNTWRERPFGKLTYRATQVMTGHGCFGVYLCRIGREATTVCHHCGAEEDSAEHTLEECPVFAVLRRVLVPNIGMHDISLSSVVGAMLEGGGLLLRAGHVAEGGRRMGSGAYLSRPSYLGAVYAYAPRAAE
nr:uncharacterized protein LOC117217755 [Megalopta genalis]